MFIVGVIVGFVTASFLFGLFLAWAAGMATRDGYK
jgi:hypothetical protein